VNEEHSNRFAFLRNDVKGDSTPINNMIETLRGRGRIRKQPLVNKEADSTRSKIEFPITKPDMTIKEMVGTSAKS